MNQKTKYPWSRDETVVVLHLFISNGRRYLKPQSTEIEGYIELRDRLGYPPRTRDSISMKTKNFIALESGFSNGLPNASKLDTQIWRELADYPEILKREVRRIAEGA